MEIMPDRYNGERVFLVFSMIGFSAMAIGQNAGLFPKAAKAEPAIKSVYSLLDRVPPIDVESKKEDSLELAAVKGSLQFEDVYFRYPSRPTNRVFSGLNFNVSAGEVVAFVGPSGSGKSTIIQLLERFYDPLDGKIFLGEQLASKFQTS